MKATLLIVSAVLCAASSVHAQISYGGEPLSFSRQVAIAAPTTVMPYVDVQSLLAEDDLDLRTKVAPYRFGATLPVDLSLDNSGAWTSFPNGDRLWRLRIESPGAYSLNAIFENFWMPPGASLFVYNDDHSDVLGEFNELNNETHGQFAIEPVPGEALTFEYFEPANAPTGLLRIGEVIHAYRDVFGTGATKAGGAKASGSCNINVNCPLGANYQDVKRTVARLVMGGVLCSGSLVTNTANDGKQYFMTANHCYSGNPATWVFQFNYEAATCAGTTGTPKSVTGATLKTKSATGDHCLVQITPAIPQNYNAYLAGWNRSTTNPTMGTGIHHPQGDIKKICQDINTLTKATFGGTSCWHISQWDSGVTEGGSSGSPIYDANKRYVGQLYGGSATCGFLFDDYYGRFDISMGAGLATYLDPTASGATTTNGRELYVATATVYCTAKVNSQLCIPAIGFNGSPSASSASPFNITCSEVLNKKNGILFYGYQPFGAAFEGGHLCVKAPTKRTAVQSTNGNPLPTDCSGTMTYDFNPLIQGGGDPALIVGASIYAQFWYRDPGDFTGFGTGLSDALSFVIGS
ncbi:MAG: hypothetical protein K8S98_18675 [Planctomycetes bacterium]|nr:hypothetical protein [Planctomycetota bacterium]